MTNNEKTGLEKYEMYLINNGYPLCILELEKHNKKMLELLTEERAIMAKVPIPCDKGLLEAIKNVVKAEPMLLKDGEMERARLISKGRLQIKEKLQKIIDYYIPQSCDKGLLEELKNWTQKEWKYNGSIYCDKEYGFSVAQNQVFEILNRYLPQLSSKQE